MKTNILVTHKKLKTLGIGCVSKIISDKKVKVNFGLEDVMTCIVTAIEQVDTSKCKTMDFKTWQAKSMCNSFKSGEVRVIIGNELKEYVGIGWTTQRVVTIEDLKKYPRVIQK